MPISASQLRPLVQTPSYQGGYLEAFEKAMGMRAASYERTLEAMDEFSTLSAQINVDPRDREYVNDRIANIQEQITAISESPEQVHTAGTKVKMLANELFRDPQLNTLIQNRAYQQEVEKQKLTSPNDMVDFAPYQGGVKFNEDTGQYEISTYTPDILNATEVEKSVTEKLGDVKSRLSEIENLQNVGGILSYKTEDVDEGDILNRVNSIVKDFTLDTDGYNQARLLLKTENQKRIANGDTPISMSAIRNADEEGHDVAINLLRRNLMMKLAPQMGTKLATTLAKSSSSDTPQEQEQKDKITNEINVSGEAVLRQSRNPISEQVDTEEVIKGDEGELENLAKEHDKQVKKAKEQSTTTLTKSVSEDLGVPSMDLLKMTPIEQNNLGRFEAVPLTEDEYVKLKVLSQAVETSGIDLATAIANYDKGDYAQLEEGARLNIDTQELDTWNNTIQKQVNDTNRILARQASINTGYNNSVEEKQTLFLNTNNENTAKSSDNLNPKEQEIVENKANSLMSTIEEVTGQENYRELAGIGVWRDTGVENTTVNIGGQDYNIVSITNPNVAGASIPKVNALFEDAGKPVPENLEGMDISELFAFSPSSESLQKDYAKAKELFKKALNVDVSEYSEDNKKAYEAYKQKKLQEEVAEGSSTLKANIITLIPNGYGEGSTSSNMKQLSPGARLQKEHQEYFKEDPLTTTDEEEGQKLNGAWLSRIDRESIYLSGKWADDDINKDVDLGNKLIFGESETDPTEYSGIDVQGYVYNTEDENWYIAGALLDKNGNKTGSTISFRPVGDMGSELNDKLENTFVVAKAGEYTEALENNVLSRGEAIPGQPITRVENSEVISTKLDNQLFYKKEDGRDLYAVSFNINDEDLDNVEKIIFNNVYGIYKSQYPEADDNAIQQAAQIKVEELQEVLSTINKSGENIRSGDYMPASKLNQIKKIIIPALENAAVYSKEISNLNEEGASDEKISAVSKVVAAFGKTGSYVDDITEQEKATRSQEGKTKYVPIYNEVFTNTVRQIGRVMGNRTDLKTQYLNQIDQESMFIDDIVSRSGAVGLAQVLPSTAKSPGYATDPVNPFDPEASIEFLITYHQGLAKDFKNKYPNLGITNNEIYSQLAFLSYNAGIGNVQKMISAINRYVPGGKGNLKEYLAEEIPQIGSDGKKYLDNVYIGPRTNTETKFDELITTILNVTAR